MLKEKQLALYRALNFENLEQLLTCAKENFDDSVYILDGNLNPLLASQILAIEQDRPLIRKLHPLDRMSPHQPVVETDRDGRKWIIGAVYRQSIPVIIVAAYRCDSWDKDCLPLCHTLLETLDLWLSAQSPRNMLYRRTSSVYINFFTELLYEKIVNRDLLHQRLQQMSFTPPEEFCIMLIDFQAHETMDVSSALAAEFVTELLDCPMFCFHNNNLIFLVDTTTKAPWRDEIEKDLSMRLSRFGLQASCSLSCTDLFLIPNAFSDAQRTLDLGRRLRPEVELYFAARYMTYVMLDLASQQLTITKSINPAMLTILEYDRKHGTNLMMTLYAYLRHMRNPEAAARQLKIHKNTFYYRMGIIRQFLDAPSLDDGEMIMQLMMSFHIMFFNGMISPLPDSNI